MNENNFYVELGKKLAELRTKNGLSQQEVSGKIGVTSQAYSLYEKGSRKIPIYYIIPISKILNFNVDDFFSEFDRENKWNERKEKINEWYDEFGHIKFTEAEINVFKSVARYLIFIRESK